MAHLDDPTDVEVSSSFLMVESGSTATAYDAATIRHEFKTYQSFLPHPDRLLQDQHSTAWLRTQFETNHLEDLPRWMKPPHQGGVAPHHALCSLLLGDYETTDNYNSVTTTTRRLVRREKHNLFYDWLVRVLSCGYLHYQLNNPADFIRDQFHRVAHVIPTTKTKAEDLRKIIKDAGLPVPNYFLDPEGDRQFPPHIALLVILQDGQKESQKLDGLLNRIAFSLFALVALLLRIVLEVIGGAGAIWGGAEVFKLRREDNGELWRWISVVVGILCLLRFITLNVPQQEDEGDILGPAGPWSLRFPVRLRAVCDHPFHYFVRALPPTASLRTKKE